MNITVWNEHEQHHREGEVAKIYPQGIHGAIAGFLRGIPGANVRTATLDQPGQGLPPDVLESTDVLLWWGHSAHDRVDDGLVKRITHRVNRGMGIIFLHSSHISKPFLSLMGTSGSLKWREASERQRLWTVDPAHPIARGVAECVVIPQEEMYGEPFDIPTPDELVFLGWFKGGNVFRSGCCYRRGRGRVFYFQPGHETYPVYHQPEIQRIISNAVMWAAPSEIAEQLTCPKDEAAESVED